MTFSEILPDKRLPLASDILRNGLYTTSAEYGELFNLRQGLLRDVCRKQCLPPLHYSYITYYIASVTTVSTSGTLSIHIVKPIHNILFIVVPYTPVTP
jgi:hypothetical protein